ncbi:MAG TPA: hypothetical protein VF762_04805 [Blastocatellia bacterium]|jgi:hypothetical protein
MRKLSCLIAALLFISATQMVPVRAHKAYVAAPVTELVLNTEPGDYIGQGKSYSYAEGDGRYDVFLRDLSHDGVVDDIIFSLNSTDFWYLEFETSKYIGGGLNYFFNRKRGLWRVSARDQNRDGVVDYITLTYDDPKVGGLFWFLDFSTANLGKGLAPGVYENAQRAPFEAAGHPGFDVAGEGRGRNMLTGRFTILDAKFDYSGEQPQIISFAAKFEQHCEGGTSALFGSIYYNSLAKPNGPTPKITKVSYDAQAALLTIKGKKFDSTVSLIINGEMVRFAPLDNRNKIASKTIKIGGVVLSPGAHTIQIANLEGAVSAPFTFSF